MSSAQSAECNQNAVLYAIKPKEDKTYAPLARLHTQGEALQLHTHPAGVITCQASNSFGLYKKDLKQILH